MGKNIRTPHHVALMREVMAAKVDARVDSNVRVFNAVCDALKEGSHADKFRPQSRNQNNNVKRARRAAGRAFKAQRQCAEFWDYTLL